ncbi:Gfo/Idh/MocA family protein [uncultured Brevibacillus sp.]|uniref:Gfo/Idh/MocA family protein n=1 Tax=uncultured Brevibacillus sp. TaxID=169970 RepID=UPI002597F6BC|nr:Gfo/Idh/MocA family oxidoreductase [uncultured Brevibacillus sp.]
MVKVVVAGSQETGKKYYEAWSGVKAAEVVGYADSLAVLRELLQEKEVDVVDILSSVEASAEWIALAAEEKKHVICGAGGQLGHAALRKAKELCEVREIQLVIGSSLRFSPEYVQAREQVRQGAIGKPGVIRVRRSAPAPEAGSAKGCIFHELGVAEFDWLRWTFGEVVRVMARRVKHTDDSGQELEYALVMLRMEDGTIAHVELSWAEASERAAFEITGDAGMIQHDSHDSQPILWQTNKRLEQKVLGWERFAHLAQLERERSLREHVVSCLSKREALAISPEDILQAQKIAQATRQSAESGQPVQLMDGGDSI